MRGTRLLGLVAAVLLAGGAAWAESASASSDQLTTSADIRINLPGGAPPVVSIEPRDNRIVLDLPAGAVFPIDFRASSGGLLGDGVVTELGPDRISLELELTRGKLDRVVYDPDGIVLRLTSRFRAGTSHQTVSDIYTLGPQDRIQVKVHNHPDLDSAITVSGEGAITVPLVGEVAAAGLSTTQLESRLTELLSRYLVTPQIEIEVEKFRSQWVMVSGEVGLPGRISLTGGTRLKEVLSDAEGFGTAAGEEITISRKKDGGDDYEVVTITREEFESGKGNPVLRHGDIIEVQRAEFCYVQGEVRSPHRVRIERDMTLLKALTLVGGLTDWADRKSVRIIRPDQPVEVHNLTKIRRGKAKDPVLYGGEVVLVDRRFF